jgi:hypothetical protein
MMQPLMLDRIAERARNGFLARHFFKGLRAPFASDYLVGHKGFAISNFRFLIGLWLTLNFL